MPDPARRALLASLLALPLGAVLYLGIPVCPTATLFGIPCPGCGLTRATLALLRGDVMGALHYHPLVFALTPLVVGLFGAALYEYIRGPSSAARQPSRPLLLRPWVSVAAGVLGVAMLGVWGARFLGYFGGPVPVERLTLPSLSSLR